LWAIDSPSFDESRATVVTESSATVESSSLVAGAVFVRPAVIAPSTEASRSGAYLDREVRRFGAEPSYRRFDPAGDVKTGRSLLEETSSVAYHGLVPSGAIPWRRMRRRAETNGLVSASAATADDA
jgi:hypothetical protein